MWSSTAAVISWIESLLNVRTGSYPPADASGDYVIVERVGGTVSYPHDSPRFAVQVWTDSDENGEQAILALSAVLHRLVEHDARINSVEQDVEVAHIGRDENGHFVWQLIFTMHCNIR